MVAVVTHRMVQVGINTSIGLSVFLAQWQHLEHCFLLFRRAYGIWYWAVYLLLYGIFISALTTYVTSYNDLVSYSYATNNTVVRYSFHEV